VVSRRFMWHHLISDSKVKTANNIARGITFVFSPCAFKIESNELIFIFNSFFILEFHKLKIYIFTMVLGGVSDHVPVFDQPIRKNDAQAMFAV